MRGIKLSSHSLDIISCHAVAYARFRKVEMANQQSKGPTLGYFLELEHYVQTNGVFLLLKNIQLWSN